MPGVKNSDSEIKANSEAALAEAIGNLDAVDGQSVAGLLNAYLDAKISSRSSHSWDPNGTIGTNLDAKVSNAGASQSDINSGAQSALAEDIATDTAAAGSVAKILSRIEGNNDLTSLDSTGGTNSQSELRDPVETAIDNLSPSAGSIAAMLNANLDAAISSRSSHSWDPNGHIDANVSSRATPIDVATEVNNAQINQDIYQAIERRVSQTWSTDSELGNWTISGLKVLNGTIQFSNVLAENVFSPTVISGSGVSNPGNIYDNDTSTKTNVDGSYVGIDWGENAHLAEFRYYGNSNHAEDGEYALEYYDDGNGWVEDSRISTRVGSWSSWLTLGVDASRVRIRQTVGDSGKYGDNSPGEIEVRVEAYNGTAESPLMSPSYLTEWDLANFDVAADGGNITVDILDGSGTAVVSDAIDGEDLSATSASKDLRMSISMGRSSTSKNPEINSAALRWIE